MLQTEVEPSQLKAWLDAGEPVVIVDVREPQEYAGWNIPGSTNVPLGELVRGASVPAGPRVVTVCASGARSETARAELARRGIPAVSLGGGMAAWNSVYDVARVHAAGAEVLQVRRVGKGCLSYVIVSGAEAAVIDPTIDIDVYEREAAQRGARIVAVLDTHAHADHLSGSRALVESTGATYHAPDEVGDAFPRARVDGGSRIRVGQAQLRTHATPGHTPASVTYALGDLLFTGDTLFVESVGRPDLGQDAPTNARTLWRTLRSTLLAQPPDARILPGHFGDGVPLQRGVPVEARLGELRERLAPLSFSEDEFVAWVARNALPKPANFETIKRINKGSREITDPEDLRWLEAGPNRCAVSG